MPQKTAAVLVIGDELLSGRTRDSNMHHLAGWLTAKGVALKEARFVGDDENDIVQSLNALRAAYDYVFTSGGIGPTHDDITADAVASAVMGGVQQAISAEQKKQAAEDMDKVGKMFEADAPAFAQEAYKVRDTFSYMGEAMSDLTDEQKAAIDQVKASPEYSSAEVGEQYDVEPSSWPLQKKLMIGGGIAAAGVAAVLAVVFLKG